MSALAAELEGIILGDKRLNRRARRVLAPHIACTETRLREHPRVLCRKAHYGAGLLHQEGHRRPWAAQL